MLHILEYNYVLIEYLRVFYHYKCIVCRNMKILKEIIIKSNAFNLKIKVFVL